MYNKINITEIYELYTFALFFYQYLVGNKFVNVSGF